jgi:DNA mismatch endonuclease, patch repair protein
MPDVFSTQKRSAVMAAIRSHGNKATELRLIAKFKAHGITGWRRHRPLFGRPDFVFSAEKLAVFVDGCFWHGCPRHGTMPVNNAAFWLKKITRNRARDMEVNRVLRAKGWRVLRIWEHDLTRKGETRLIKRLRLQLVTPPVVSAKKGRSWVLRPLSGSRL